MNNLFGIIVKETIRAAEKSNQRNPEDYIGENGLLVCGKCGTPKQCMFKALGEERIVYCLCECKQREQEEKRQLLEKEKKKFRRSEIRERAFSDRYTRSFDFSVDECKDTETSRFMRNYAASFDPKSSDGLLLHGDCGTGKSFYAACIVNALIDRDFTAKFTSISEIERELWNASNKNDVYEGLAALNLLVLDDFSVERDTSYMQEIIYNVVEMRSRRKMPMVITTNLKPTDFKSAREQWQLRVFSRILGNCIPYAVVGNDRRREKAKRSYTEKISEIINFSGKEQK